MSKASKYAYWLNKPVAVQFKAPYVLCEDLGAVDVKTVVKTPGLTPDQEKTEEVIITFGAPGLVLRDVQYNDPARGITAVPNPTPGMSGVLLEDPVNPDLLIMRTQLVVGDPGQVEIAFDPDVILFITAIPEHKHKSRLVT